MVQFFVKLLSSQKDDNWPLPIMYTVCLDLRLFAGKADSQLSSKGGKPGETLEKVTSINLTPTVCHHKSMISPSDSLFECVVKIQK